MKGAGIGLHKHCRGGKESGVSERGKRREGKEGEEEKEKGPIEKTEEGTKRRSRGEKERGGRESGVWLTRTQFY